MSLACPERGADRLCAASVVPIACPDHGHDARHLSKGLCLNTVYGFIQASAKTARHPHASGRQTTQCQQTFKQEACKSCVPRTHTHTHTESLPCTVKSRSERDEAVASAWSLKTGMSPEPGTSHVL